MSYKPRIERPASRTPVSSSSAAIRAETAPAPLRVLLVGEFGSHAAFPYFGRAMRERGWDVGEIDTLRYFGSIGNRVIDRLAWAIAPQSFAVPMRVEILRRAGLSGADVVLFAKGFGVNTSLLDQLHSMGCRTVCWYPDRDFDHDQIDAACLAGYGLVITTKRYQLDYLTSLRGVRPTLFLDHGYCDDVHIGVRPPFPAESRPFDVMFVGNHSAHKEANLRAIASHCPGVKFAVIGGPVWLSAKHGALSDSTVGGPINGSGMIRAIQNARIALAIHHGEAANGSGWADAVSTRTFEIAASGTFMLHVDNPEVRSLFEVGTEIDTFADPAEAAKKITHWLTNAELREQMAERAFVRAVPAYGYQAIGKRLADMLERLIDAPMDTRP
jgi:spore maturation protein CgeB